MFLHIMDMLQIHISVGSICNFMVCHGCFFRFRKKIHLVRKRSCFNLKYLVLLPQMRFCSCEVSLKISTGFTPTDVETQSPTSTNESELVYIERSLTHYVYCPCVTYDTDTSQRIHAVQKH